MATIANLAAKVSADGSGFEKTMDKTKKKIEEVESTGQKLTRVYGAVKVVALAVAAFMAANLFNKHVGELLDELNIARQADIDVRAIKDLQQALRDVGQPTEVAARTFSTLAQTLASIQSGNAGAADALTRLGLNAEKLSKTKPDVALRMIADQLHHIKDPAKRAAIAFQLFGEDAKALLPVLSQGSKAFIEAGMRVDKFGSNVNNLELSNLETVKILFDNVSQVAKNLATRLAVELLPILIVVIQSFGSIAEVAGSISFLVKTWIIGMLYIGAAIADIGSGVKAMFQMTLLGFNGIYLEALKLVEELFNLASRLPGAAGKMAIDSLGIIRNMRSRAEQEQKGLIKDVDDTIGKGIFKNVENAASLIDHLFEQADKLAGKANKARTDNGSVPQVHKHDAAFKESMNIFNETQTPLEKYANKMDMLNLLLDKGALSWQTYARATSNAVNELEKAHDLQGMGLAQGLKMNTSEAVSAINRAKQQDDIRFRESPIDRVRRILMESKAIEAQQLEQQKRIADAARNQKVARF